MAQYADYSGGRPSGAALKAAGFSGAIRYVGLGTSGKRITAAEYRDLVANGLDVLLVAEYDVADAWGGYNAGYSNAHAALNDAQLLGIPDSVPIAAAADSHATTAAQIAAAVDYARAFRDVLGHARAGFYGFSETSQAVRTAGVVSWHWRCGSAPAGADAGWVNFWQRNAAPTVLVVNGITCDINDLLNPLTEADMAFTPDDFANFMWHNVFDANGNRNYAQFIKDMDGKLQALSTALDTVAKLITDSTQHPVDAEQLAAALEGKLIADLIPAVSQAVADKIGQEQATEVADAVRAMLVARLGTPA